MSRELPQITIEFAPDTGQEPPAADPTPATRRKKAAKEGPADVIDIPPDEILFQKQYYPIGEVAQMFHVNISLIRYWEGEFGFKLRKNKKGDRFFTPKDVKTMQLVYDLIRRRKFTLEGARDYLKNAKGAEEKYAMIESLQRLKGFLLELKAHL